MVVPNQQKRDGLTIDKRLVFLAAAGALVTIPEPRDTVVVRPLDIEAELHRAGKDFLMVLSVPPRSMALGETLAYQIDARSSGGNIKYKLESGPEGMTVSDDGLVQWTPASRPPDGAATGVVSVAAGARAVKHAMTIDVRPPADLSGQAEGGPPPGAWSPEKPPSKPAGNLVMKLPAKYDDVCAGGGGRFLVFSLASLHKLAVFDVRTARVVGYVPADGSHCLFAAGAEKLVVLDCDQQQIQRFDLQTQKLEATHHLSLDGSAVAAAMGNASRGPVLIAEQAAKRPFHVELLDLETLQPPDYQITRQDNFQTTAVTYLRASGDGRVFGVWRGNTAPTGLQTLLIHGNELRPFSVRNSSAGWVVPDETGGWVYTAVGMFTDELAEVGSREAPDRGFGAPIPALCGPFFARVEYAPMTSTKIKTPATITVHVVGEQQPLATLSDMPIRCADWRGGLATNSERGPMTLDKQVWLVPNENVLAVLPEERDSVVLRRLDVQEELRKWDKDCLVLTTLPPRFVAVGQTFEHQFGDTIQTGKRLLQTRLGPGRHGPFGKRVAALAGQGPACGRHGHRGLHGERCRRSRGLADFYDPRRGLGGRARRFRGDRPGGRR